MLKRKVERVMGIERRLAEASRRHERVLLSGSLTELGVPALLTSVA